MPVPQPTSSTRVRRRESAQVMRVKRAPHPVVAADLLVVLGGDRVVGVSR